MEHGMTPGLHSCLMAQSVHWLCLEWLLDSTMTTAGARVALRLHHGWAWSSSWTLLPHWGPQQLCNVATSGLTSRTQQLRPLPDHAHTKLLQGGGFNNHPPNVFLFCFRFFGTLGGSPTFAEVSVFFLCGPNPRIYISKDGATLCY